MGSLFSQKRWFKSWKNNDSDEDQQENRIQVGIRFVVAFFIKCYLQFLFTIGAFRGRSWVDKHIKVCYNRLDELKITYDYSTHKQWYK